MLQEAFSRMTEVFEHKVLLRGQHYHDEGKVLSIRLSEGLFKARVKGSSAQIYDVHMDLKVWPRQPARCSCQFHINCKHAAASLFELHAREQNSKGEQKPGTLDRKLDMWLKNLRVQQEVRREEMATHRLTYLIEPKLQLSEHKLLIRLALAKILKRGGLGRKTVFHNLSDSKKQHFIEDDDDIVARLMYRCGVQGWFDAIPLRNSELLHKIIKTGRAYVYDEEDMLVSEGEPLDAQCEWILLSNGHQHIELRHEGKPLVPLLLDEPWYIDDTRPCMGRLDISYPSRQLQYLLNAPPIPLAQAELLAKKMAQSFPEFPAPKRYEEREFHEVEPTPYVVFDHLDSDTHFHRSWLEEEMLKLTIEPGFEYEGHQIAAEDPSSYAVSYRDGTLHQYSRQTEFEQLKMDELFECVSMHPPTLADHRFYEKKPGFYFILDEFSDDEDGFTHLYQTVIPMLKSKGWKIYFNSPVFQEIIRADEVQWFSDLNESGNDFFSYQLGILIDGNQVSIVPLVAKLIGQYSNKDALDQLADDHLVTLPLGDGKVLELEAARIKPLVRLLLQYGLRNIKNEAQQLKISRYQLMLMQEAEQAMAASSARWQGAEELRSQLLTLANKADFPEVGVPKGLKAELRDYQHEGLNWLQFLRENQFGGILADDMGLGKTVQTLAHLQVEKEQGRMKKASLIIAPTSLVGNWHAEAKRFTPELKILVFHGSDRYQDDFDDYDIVISTYGLIQRDKNRFLDYSFYYLILDESQFIKNARTKTTQIIQQLKATHRLCLTGTPLENHLGELWSLFHFLMPGLLGDSRQFRQWFKTPIEKNADEGRRHLLANRVKPFMLRRTKNEVAKDLPLKTEMTRTIEITGAQRDLYEAIRMSMEKKVRQAITKQGLNKSHIVLLDALLKLRQVCCDPQLLSLPEATMAHGSSAKFDVLMELIDNLMEEGRRVLIFSQFTTMLALIEAELIARNYDYLKLTGQTQNRQNLVERFQQGHAPIFLISLKAGGTGLNLTKADTVIHYDPWWNPAVEDQATDRSHRIGQENPVFVYKLITKGTVEEVILGMQAKKRQLVEGVLSSDSSGMTSLTDQDISQFFTALS